MPAPPALRRSKFRVAATGCLLALVAVSAAMEGRAQPPGSSGLERYREGPGVIDSPARGGNVFNNFPSFTIDRKGKDAKPAAPAEDSVEDPLAPAEEPAAPPSRSESVTDRILREIELRKSIAKRRQALARSRAKGTGPEDEPEASDARGFADIVGFGDDPEPPRSTTGRATVPEEAPVEGAPGARLSTRRDRSGATPAAAPRERGLTGRSAIDASRRPVSGGIRAGAPAARSGWGSATGRAGSGAQTGPKPLNAGRPFAPAAGGRPGTGATPEAGTTTSGRMATGGRGGDLPARRPPLLPQRPAP